MIFEREVVSGIASLVKEDMPMFGDEPLKDQDKSGFKVVRFFCIIKMMVF